MYLFNGMLDMFCNKTHWFVIRHASISLKLQQPTVSLLASRETCQLDTRLCKLITAKAAKLDAFSGHLPFMPTSQSL